MTSKKGWNRAIRFPPFFFVVFIFRYIVADIYPHIF